MQYFCFGFGFFIVRLFQRWDNMLTAKKLYIIPNIQAITIDYVFLSTLFEKDCIRKLLDKSNMLTIWCPIC